MRPDQIVRWVSDSEARKFLVAPQSSKPMFVTRETADSVGMPTHERLLELMRKNRLFETDDAIHGGFCIVEDGQLKFRGMSPHPVIQLVRAAFYQMIQDEKREIHLISMDGEVVQK